MRVRRAQAAAMAYVNLGVKARFLPTPVIPAKAGIQKAADAVGTPASAAWQRMASSPAADAG